MSSQPKWLRQAAAEIRAEGHAGWGNTCEQAADEFDALLLKLPSWVNSDERLPDNTKLVLAWVVDGDYGRAHVLYYHVTHGWTGYFPFETKQITHWMPLPEPPK